MVQAGEHSNSGQPSRLTGVAMSLRPVMSFHLLIESGGRAGINNDNDQDGQVGNAHDQLPFDSLTVC